MGAGVDCHCKTDDTVLWVPALIVIVKQTTLYYGCRRSDFIWLVSYPVVACHRLNVDDQRQSHFSHLRHVVMIAVPFF